MTRVLIVEARFYNHIADGLLKGAKAALEQAGVDYTVITVPGIFEVPATVAYALRAAELVPGADRYDGYVALGCAIRGETDHYHHVCSEAMNGLQQLAVQHCLALGNGLLTVHNEAQALARSEPERKNMGGQAARACLRMMQLKRELSIVS